MQNRRMQTDRYTMVLIASLLFWATPVCSSIKTDAAEPFTPYTAKYTVSRSGATIAEAIFTLSRTNQGWQFQSHARPRGFAALFTSEEITENSLFDLHEGSVRPLFYQTAQGAPKDKNKKILRAQYDWQSGNVAIDNGKESAHASIDGKTHDPLSVQLALMQRIK